MRLVRDGEGWNIRELVKERAQEADREGPDRTDLAPVDRDRRRRGLRSTTPPARRTTALPQRIDDLDVQASFEYEPVHFTVGLKQLSFRGAEPDLVVQQLNGGVAVRDDNLYLERMVVKTGDGRVQPWR